MSSAALDFTPVPLPGADVDLLTTLYAEDRRSAEQEIQLAEEAIVEHRYEDAVAVVTAAASATGMRHAPTSSVRSSSPKVSATAAPPRTSSS